MCSRTLAIAIMKGALAWHVLSMFFEGVQSTQPSMTLALDRPIGRPPSGREQGATCAHNGTCCPTMTPPPGRKRVGNNIIMLNLLAQRIDLLIIIL